MNYSGTHLKNTGTNGILSPMLSKGDLVSSFQWPMEGSPRLTGYLAIHCRNRLQSIQRAKSVAEDTVTPSTGEPSSGTENPASPLPSSSTPSTPSSSDHPTPEEELVQDNPSTAPAVSIYDGEPDCQFNPEFPPGAHRTEGFQIPPQVLQHAFPITISTPTDDPTGCWQGGIPPSELWKGPSPENTIIGENVQFYQPPPVLTVHINPSPQTFNNTSPHQTIPFTMTCPVPHCCYQCQTVVEIWRHITWAHVRPQPDDGIEGIVEKVVLGNV